MPLEIDIDIHAGNWDGAFVERIPSLLQHVADTVELDIGELSLVLADDAFVQELNKNYRGKDKPTNVLSFPQDPPLLGDIVLALDTVLREADEQGKRFEDHCTHLLIHGFLHLLGHDHEEEEEAAVMENIEIQILASLGIKNPYEDGDFVP